MIDSMNIQQAAEYLFINEETLRRYAQSGRIPAAKPGKRWVFLKPDLDGYLRSLYSQQWRALLSEPMDGGKSCHSANAETCGGFSSLHPQESELDALLKQV